MPVNYAKVVTGEACEYHGYPTNLSGPDDEGVRVMGPVNHWWKFKRLGPSSARSSERTPASNDAKDVWLYLLAAPWRRIEQERPFIAAVRRDGEEMFEINPAFYQVLQIE